MRNTRFYAIWCGIKTRCLNSTNKDYKNYGGRGITVCKEWLDFQNFYDDMFPDYCEHAYWFGEKQTTIDRIDNDGNYEFENCRWNTLGKQQSNKRKDGYKKRIRSKNGRFMAN